MKPTEQNCDTQRIDDYLDERLSETQASEFEQHLCDCERCRSELQQRSAEPDVWRDAAALLGPDSTSNSDRDSSLGSSPSSQSDSVRYPELGSLRSYGNDSSGSGEQATDEHKVSQRERYILSVLDSLAPTDDPEMLGRVGDYEISGVVGVGGMGAVLKGFDKSLRRVVAIKVMAPHLAHSGSARTRFQREARAAAAITHDNVIDIYAVSEAGGLPYLVMPYARGPSLQKRIDQGGPLGVVEVVRIGRQIAAGLSAAHEQGLVHRDIKPANILLSDGIERLWITDFGVARAMDDASMTQTGVIAGTPQYMSPEQARGESVDHRSDLFSLGSVLYTACTGRPPFRSEAAYGILRRITDSDPRPIREINPDIPEWLCEIIARLQAKHPADRFESASEVVNLLDGCLAHLQQPHQVELPPSLRGKRSIDGTKFLGQAVEIDHSGEERQLTQRSQQTQLTQQALPSPQPKRRFIKRVFIMTGSILLAGLFGLLTMQLTNPMDISGHWSGENWKHVSLASVDEASDWYSGTFIDSAGRRGAVRLEWSRLQRRYNGRWKVGDAESGEITLRAGENGTLRGAVSVDPDSQLAPDSPRLLEFAWQPASKEAQQHFESQAAQLKAAQPQRKSQDSSQQIARAVSVKSPTPGVIVKASDSVKLNALVKKGDLIVEVEATKSASIEQGQAQLSVLEQQIEAHAQKIEVAENELEVLKAMCVDYKHRTKIFEAVKEKNAIEISAGRETESTNLKVQGELDSALVALKKAEADVVKVETKRQSYQQEQAVLQKNALDLKSKLSELERLQIVAPVTGTITYLAAFSKGDVVKEGDLIVEVTPESEWPPKSGVSTKNTIATSPIGQASRPATETTAVPTLESSPISSIPSLAAFGPASELAKRLRLSRQRLAGNASAIEAGETKLKTLQLELLALREQQIQIPEQDVQRREELEHNQKAIESTTHAMEEEIKIAKKAQKDAEAEMSEAEHERTTILKMLQNQLSTAQRQLESQRASRGRMEQLYKEGLTSQETMSKADQVIVGVESEIRQLELLIDFYGRLGRG